MRMAGSIVASQFFQKQFRQHGIAIFAAHHFDQHALAVDMFGFQSSDFPGPESCRVCGHECQPVLDVSGAVDNLPDLIFGERRGKLAWFFA